MSLLKKSYPSPVIILALAYGWAVFCLSHGLKKEKEKEQEARKNELAVKIARTDSIYKIRINDMTKQYRKTQDVIREMNFESEEDRAMARNAAESAFAFRRGDLKNEHAHIKDSLQALYIQATRQR